MIYLSLVIFKFVSNDIIAQEQLLILMKIT